MTSKERVKITLEHKEPDRIPTGEFSIEYSVIEAVLGHPSYCKAKWKEQNAIWDGKRDEVVESTKKDLVDIILKLGLDLVVAPITYSSKLNYPHRPQFIDPRTWYDEDGNIWKYTPDIEEIAIIKYKQPEATLSSIEKYCADINDISRYEVINCVVEKLGKTHFILSGFSQNAFSLNIFHKGIEETLLKSALDANLVKKAIKIKEEFMLAEAKNIIKTGVDGVMLGADYCDKNGPMISPSMWKDFFAQPIKNLVDKYHKAGLYVFFHSCGNTWKILDMLLDCGIDVYQSISQNANMDIIKLKRKYKGRLAFMGGVETETLINGTEEEVIQETKVVLKEVAPGGGLIFSSSHSIFKGVKPANYLAMLGALNKYVRII